MDNVARPLLNLAAWHASADDQYLDICFQASLYSLALVPFRVTHLRSAFMPLFASRRSHGARSHGPGSLKPLPGLDGS